MYKILCESVFLKSSSHKIIEIMHVFILTESMYKG